MPPLLARFRKRLQEHRNLKILSNSLAALSSPTRQTPMGIHIRARLENSGLKQMVLDRCSLPKLSAEVEKHIPEIAKEGARISPQTTPEILACTQFAATLVEFFDEIIRTPEVLFQREIENISGRARNLTRHVRNILEPLDYRGWYADEEEIASQLGSDFQFIGSCNYLWFFGAQLFSHYRILPWVIQNLTQGTSWLVLKEGGNRGAQPYANRINIMGIFLFLIMDEACKIVSKREEATKDERGRLKFFVKQTSRFLPQVLSNQGLPKKPI